jgi:hypothetical protein
LPQVRETLLIVDDFLDNAVEFREAALRLTYPPTATDSGRRDSLERINLEGLDRQISWLVNEPLAPVSTSQSHARCSLRLAQDEQIRRILINDGDWSGMLFLSRPEYDGPGLDFFRHVRTATDGSELNAAQVATSGDIVRKDAADETEWERIMRVPIRFNRLVLFRSWLWHAEGPGMGERPEDGWMAYQMLFASGS